MHPALGRTRPSTKVQVLQSPPLGSGTQKLQVTQSLVGCLARAWYLKVVRVARSPGESCEMSLQGSAASLAAWTALWGCELLLAVGRTTYIVPNFAI